MPDPVQNQPQAPNLRRPPTAGGPRRVPQQPQQPQQSPARRSAPWKKALKIAAPFIGTGTGIISFLFLS